MVLLLWRNLTLLLLLFSFSFFAGLVPGFKWQRKQNEKSPSGKKGFTQFVNVRHGRLKSDCWSVGWESSNVFS